MKLEASVETREDPWLRVPGWR